MEKQKIKKKEERKKERRSKVKRKIMHRIQKKGKKRKGEIPRKKKDRQIDRLLRKMKGSFSCKHFMKMKDKQQKKQRLITFLQ